MQNTKRLSELLTGPGKRLGSLRKRAAERASVLTQVQAAVTPKLAEFVVTAGIEDGLLTIGVGSAAWASRLRYCADVLREKVAQSSGEDLKRVRIRVLPPGT
jgi:hypothetical protein